MIVYTLIVTAALAALIGLAVGLFMNLQPQKVLVPQKGRHLSGYVVDNNKNFMSYSGSEQA